MLVGLGGVAWLAAPWETSATALHTGGVVAILGGCISWAVGSIYSRHATSGAPPFLASALQMLCGSGALLIMAWAHGDFSRLVVSEISPRSWTAFAYLIAFGSLIGFSTFVWLLKHTTPARASTYAYVNPVVAVFLGWLVLGEPVTSRTIGASLVIVGAVAIITLQQSQKRPAPPKLPR
ncbi:MAG TPA: EamA family transporter, partial [Candidatus Synoicihabitans sp.]|nr:EamA family transporter [Candidatus Synoicihabitans sp.]